MIVATQIILGLFFSITVISTVVFLMDYDEKERKEQEALKKQRQLLEQCLTQKQDKN